MSEWVIDHKLPIYFLLAAAIIACLALWWRLRRRYFLIVTVMGGILLLGLLVLDRIVETDGEQMVRKVREIAAAVSANNLDAAFDHVSAKFDRPPRTKQSFRDLCTRVRSAGQVADVQVWDLSEADVSPAMGVGAVEFRFKVRGSWGETPPNYFCRAAFTLDPDRQWRVKTFDIYDSLNQSRTPKPSRGGDSS